MPDYPHFSFEIHHSSSNSRARLGRLTTPHGTLDTPNFIFCATKAAIKAANPRDLHEAQVDIILSNTYHLMLQPTAELVAQMGGLHQFMGWNKPMLTDSGGFQIFSLGHGSVASEIKGNRQQTLPTTLKRITEEGATFKSYVDGSMHMLTPEKSIDVQRKLGADLILVLDECTPFHVDKNYTAQSMQMTHRWAKRCLTEFERGHEGKQALYGIVQGGIYPDLRQEAAEFISAQPFFGYAVGGSLGAEKSQMYEVVAYAMAHLRRDRPVHLLGIGGVADIWEGITQGIDTFDCVAPTRIARHGWALVRWHPRGRLNLHNAQFRTDARPLDPECDCATCRQYSRAYIQHLLRAGELQAMHLLTVHNIRFMTRLLTTIRAAIAADAVDVAKAAWFQTDAQYYQ